MRASDSAGPLWVCCRLRCNLSGLEMTADAHPPPCSTAARSTQTGLAVGAAHPTWLLSPVSGVPPSCFLWIGSWWDTSHLLPQSPGGVFWQRPWKKEDNAVARPELPCVRDQEPREGSPSARRSCCFLSCSAHLGPGGIISSQQGWFCFVPQSLAHMLDGCQVSATS